MDRELGLSEVQSVQRMGRYPKADGGGDRPLLRVLAHEHAAGCR
jgi:hypothetical protein